jgi:predicted aspartyl protease
MYDEMGSFRIEVAVENPAATGIRETFQSVLVDTGAELSVFPAPVLDALGIVRLKPLRFRQADGTVFQRWTGSARIYAANTVATDDVVFGEPGDLMLLGARSLEGLNVRIDPVSKQLVDAGPMPRAAFSFCAARPLAAGLGETGNGSPTPMTACGRRISIAE